MKKILASRTQSLLMPLTVLIATSPLTSQASSLTPSRPKLTSCYATRLVEMRNTVLATHLLCKQVINEETYNWFLTENRERIVAANKVAVASFLKRDGSRAKFDRLDSLTMNNVALMASKNPYAFCTETAPALRALVVKMPIDQLLKEQTLIEVLGCSVN